MLMFTLLAPWLIICTLTPSSESASNPVARIADEWDASQIIVTIALPVLVCTSATLPRSSRRPERSVLQFTVQETETSLVAITSMLMFHLRNWLKMCARNPAAPSIRVETISMTVTCLISVMAHTGGTLPVCFSTMIEPGLVMLYEFFTRTGVPVRLHGSIERG